MALVSEPEAVAAVAAAIAKASLVAFDLEFLSAERLIPELCLIQVAWLDAADPAIVAPHVQLVDPLAVDAGPIVRALASHPLVVAHAPRQDLALLSTKFGTGMTGLVDTQLMAAFCGIGDQVGLGALAGDLLGLSLAKEMQWTAWERRPLSDQQLAYADADVRHLPALYAKLAARLGPRVAWAREESAQIVADALAAASVTPETAWQHVGGVRGLDAVGQGVVATVAAWRQRIAIELDRPLGQVLADKLIVEIARHRLTTGNAVRGAKGLSPLARSRADEIAAAIAGAKPIVLAKPPSRTAGVRAQRWAEMLLTIVHVIADDTNIASRLLGTRADAEEFARVVEEHGLAAAAALPALATWRRELVGAAWEGWLGGRIAIVGDAAAAHGVRLLPYAVIDS